MEDCLFCKIVSGAIPCEKVYEDDAVLAFRDIDPKAPVHVLIVPKAHCKDILDEHAADVAGAMYKAAAAIAKELGVAENGFRAVMNTGVNAGQSVPHLHMHLLGGRSLAWPPG